MERGTHWIMKNCPDCGSELSSADLFCPSCKKRVKPPFTIRQFLWENFRFFTMIGITATMISLIPNMGTRILGPSWITDPDSILPLFLSIIIFFGAMFLAICFLVIFSLVFEGRDTENAQKKIALQSRTLITWYGGDSQRSILLLCLVPMWVGLTLFFILLMPLIPNQYSWLFAAVIGLTCIPLVIFSFLGWNIGKKIIRIIPGMDKFPRLGTVVSALLLIGCIVLVPLAISQFSGTADTSFENIRIRADQQYFSPSVSSAQGLRLEITNVSGRDLRESRHTWSADYGYFVRVMPTTSEVIILGNPVYDDTSRDIYWTYAGNDPHQNKKPVTIDLHLYPLQGNEEIARSSLYLTWYTNEIAYVNTSFEAPL
jgi:hypothetical protein